MQRAVAQGGKLVAGRAGSSRSTSAFATCRRLAAGGNHTGLDTAQARTDLSMWLRSLFLIIVGAGVFSLDARLARRRT